MKILYGVLGCLLLMTKLAHGQAADGSAREPESAFSEEDGEDSERPRQTSRPGDRWREVAPYFAAGTAVVFAGGALGAGLWGASTYSEAMVTVDHDRRAELWHAANQQKAVSMALGATSFAFAGLAVWLFHREAKRQEKVMERRGVVSLIPQVSGESVGVVFTLER